MKSTIYDLFTRLKQVQEDFEKEFGVSEIISNSKVFEVLIADNLNHKLIPGHSGSRDAKDLSGEYEYKHFKELSSNHSWTFNDFSDKTIEKLKDASAVIFAHINDKVYPPKFDWFYFVSGPQVSDYLVLHTKKITNTRKMINISPKQIESELRVAKTLISTQKIGPYSSWVQKIFEIVKEMESVSKTKNLLTSNKLWELLVASKMGHKVNSEQGGRSGAHDATDTEGNKYEYKVSKSRSWNFQDISETVLKKYLNDKLIILAVVDKEKLAITGLYEANPNNVVKRLEEKLNEKRMRYEQRGGLRRLQVSLSVGDLKKIFAKKVI